MKKISQSNRRLEMIQNGASQPHLPNTSNPNIQTIATPTNFQLQMQSHHNFNSAGGPKPSSKEGYPHSHRENYQQGKPSPN